MLLCLHINLAAQTFVALQSVEVEYAQRELWACKILAEGKGKKKEDKPSLGMAPPW